MFSRPINLPIRELQKSQEAYYRRLIGEQQWTYENIRTAYGPLGEMITGSWIPNNTPHPAHSEKEQERPALPDCGEETSSAGGSR